MNKDEISAITDATREIVKPVYEDGLKPATQEIGKSLQTVSGVINIALMPIAVLVHGFKEIEQKLKNDLSKKLSGINKEQIKEPPLNVVGPLLEKYKYNHDTEILSDMFISLLANSMDSERSVEAHPVFVDIISQLSSDEAKLFKAIATSPICPKLDIGVEDIKNKGYTMVRRNFIDSKISSGLQYPSFLSAYIDNLQRLSLINYTSGSLQEHYKEETVYNSLIEDPLVKNIEKAIDFESQKIKIFKGVISVSDFGNNFYKAISREDK